MHYKFINIVALSDADLQRQIEELKAEGWEVNPGNPRREGRLLFTHLQKIEAVCALPNGAAPQSLPDALRSMRLALEAPAVAGFPDQLSEVEDALLSIKGQAEKCVARETHAPVVNEAKATLLPLASTLFTHFDAFRLSLGSFIAGHSRLLEDIEAAHHRSIALLDAKRDLETAITQVQELALTESRS